MDEKKYCSQCHNSAFVNIHHSHTPLGVEMLSGTRKHCLYCFKLHKFLVSYQRIPDVSVVPGCRFVSESADKLYRGVWKAHTEREALRDYAEYTKARG